MLQEVCKVHGCKLQGRRARPDSNGFVPAILILVCTQCERERCEREREEETVQALREANGVAK